MHPSIVGGADIYDSYVYILIIYIQLGYLHVYGLRCIISYLWDRF